METQVTADENFDCIVVGGGPGGATAATLIAMQGHKWLSLARAAREAREVIGASSRKSAGATALAVAGGRGLEATRHARGEHQP